MTSNTTQLASDLAELGVARVLPCRSLFGSTAPAPDAVRRRLRKLVPVMLAFLTGTIGGALAYRSLGLVCLVLAIGAVAALAAWAACSRPSATR
jgi:hypothetical protein